MNYARSKENNMILRFNDAMTRDTTDGKNTLGPTFLNDTAVGTYLRVYLSSFAVSRKGN